MRSLFVLGGLVLVVACNTAELRTTPSETAPPVDPEIEIEGGEESDTDSAPQKTTTTVQKENPDGGAAAPADAGANLSCPAPAKVTPAEVPSGFIKPVKVTIASLADGDSGSFNFPSAPRQGVRLLWVNTEESGGAEMTPFGVETKGKVFAMYRAAAEIQIAVQESSPGSGRPKLDPYDRWLSLVFVDGELLQTRLVREGLSAYYTQFGCAPAPVHNALLHAEAEANDNDRGIWGPGEHNDYERVLAQWIGNRTCRPNPFKSPYCR